MSLLKFYTHSYLSLVYNPPPSIPHTFSHIFTSHDTPNSSHSFTISSCTPFVLSTFYFSTFQPSVYPVIFFFLQNPNATQKPTMLHQPFYHHLYSTSPENTFSICSQLLPRISHRNGSIRPSRHKTTTPKHASTLLLHEWVTAELIILCNGVFSRNETTLLLSKETIKGKGHER